MKFKTLSGTWPKGRGSGCGCSNADLQGGQAVREKAKILANANVNYFNGPYLQSFSVCTTIFCILGLMRISAFGIASRA